MVVVQKELKMEYYLWQLFTIEKDIESTQSELAVDKANLEEFVQEQDKLELEIREMKKEQATHMKEAILCEKRMTKRKSELDKKVGAMFYSGGTVWVLHQLLPLEFALTG